LDLPFSSTAAKYDRVAILDTAEGGFLFINQYKRRHGVIRLTFLIKLPDAFCEAFSA
jgi:hypothetical protein